MARLLGAISTLVALFLLFFNNALAEDMLFNGETLLEQQFLENGAYRFFMQNDCNLVLYVDRTRALWASNTAGAGTSCRATLLDNGNFVVRAGNNTVLWQSNTNRGNNNYRLIVQGDGNVVIYGAPVWATNTVQN